MSYLVFYSSYLLIKIGFLLCIHHSHFYSFSNYVQMSCYLPILKLMPLDSNHIPDTSCLMLVSNYNNHMLFNSCIHYASLESPFLLLYSYFVLMNILLMVLIILILKTNISFDNFIIFMFSYLFIIFYK